MRRRRGTVQRQIIEGSGLGSGPLARAAVFPLPRSGSSARAKVPGKVIVFAQHPHGAVAGAASTHASGGAAAGDDPFAADLECPTPIDDAAPRAYPLPLAAGRRCACLRPRRRASARFGGCFLGPRSLGTFVLRPGNGFILFADVAAGASGLTQCGVGFEQHCNRDQKPKRLDSGPACEFRATHQLSHRSFPSALRQVTRRSRQQTLSALSKGNLAPAHQKVQVAKIRGGKADIVSGNRDVCFWPLADVPTCTAHGRFRG